MGGGADRVDGGGGKLTGVIIYNGESAIVALFGNFVLFHIVCENLPALADPSRVRDSRG